MLFSQWASQYFDGNRVDNCDGVAHGQSERGGSLFGAVRGRRVGFEFFRAAGIRRECSWLRANYARTQLAYCGTRRQIISLQPVSYTCRRHFSKKLKLFID